MLHILELFNMYAFNTWDNCSVWYCRWHNIFVGFFTFEKWAPMRCALLSKIYSLHTIFACKTHKSLHREFETLATSVLDECHHNDPNKTLLVLMRKTPCWNETCLQIAASANDQVNTVRIPFAYRCMRLYSNWGRSLYRFWASLSVWISFCACLFKVWDTGLFLWKDCHYMPCYALIYMKSLYVCFASPKWICSYEIYKCHNCWSFPKCFVCVEHFLKPF